MKELLELLLDNLWWLVVVVPVGVILHSMHGDAVDYNRPEDDEVIDKKDK